MPQLNLKANHYSLVNFLIQIKQLNLYFYKILVKNLKSLEIYYSYVFENLFDFIKKITQINKILLYIISFVICHF